MDKLRHIALLWMGLSITLLMSCATKREAQKNSNENLVIYPAPPDTPRIQYLTSFSSSEDVAGKRAGLSQYVLGDKQEIKIVKPYGALLNKGKLYVCDMGFGSIDIIDLEKKSFEHLNTSGLGKLISPLNCSIDENDILYVADGERRQIVVFDLNKGYMTAFGNEVDFRPTDVVAYDEKIWVCDIGNNRVNVYQTGSFELLYTIPEEGTEKDELLYSPTNIFVTDNKVYVSGFGDFKIKIYTHQGKYLSSVGSYGRNHGQFIRPKGIAVDHDSTLYVVDGGFENTQMFNSDGELLMFFGGTYKNPGDMWLPAKITIDYDNIKYFEQYVAEQFDLKFVIIVTNQFGPDKVNVYGFIEPKK